MMGFLVFLFFSLLFSLAGVIIYLMYWPIKTHLIRKEILSLKRSRQINCIYLIIIFLCICITTYIGLYPSEDFYADEFKKVTSVELPESADFISKSTDYPDFHGDYCSSAALKLSKKDFKLLLLEMNNDLKMKKNAEIVSFAAFDKILNESDNKKITYSFIRNTSELNDNYLFIGFCDDAETIFVNVCCL